MNYDICIIGGGMVGAAAALSLSQLGYKIVVIEQKDVTPYDPAELPNLRVSALNMHSVELLKSIDAWEHLVAMRVRPYQKLSCWEQPSSKTQFDASSLGYEQLGYFAENRLIQLALWQQIEFVGNIELVLGKLADKINIQTGEITLDDGSEIKSTVIIGADGANSNVRKFAGIGTSGWQYGQSANVFNVKMNEVFDAETWQQFTPGGPLAFLPLYGQYASLVWYADADTTEDLQACDVSQQLIAIKHAFPEQLGDFEIIESGYFNLTRRHANNYYQDRVVLLGDAAHTINPLAGQGVNLGFKDVVALQKSFTKYGIEAHQKVFANYENKRRVQNLIMMTAMDAIYLTFSNSIKPLQLLRNLGLKVAENSGPVKLQVLKYAMGLSGTEN